jgi:guanylate kinase
VKPFPLILSSPSGGGKSAIAERLLATRTDLGYSVSCTTRPPRAARPLHPAEVNGVHYHFITRDEFEARARRGEFAEWAEVHGHLYGTLRSEVERVLRSGRHVIMDIDVQGAAQFRRAFPESVLVFILPPSADVLLERLRRRDTESQPAMASRLMSALAELRAIGEYPYVVVNDALDRAVAQVSCIIDAEMLRRERQPDLKSGLRVLADRLELEVASLSS